jgi:transcriptional regulator GlxA family with amidase domain
MTHVRNRRLERVRAALLTSEESTSVVALDAGFTHLGRFAAAYRERFGELPSATRSRRGHPVAGVDRGKRHLIPAPTRSP